MAFKKKLDYCPSFVYTAINLNSSMNDFMCTKRSCKSIVLLFIKAIGCSSWCAYMRVKRGSDAFLSLHIYRRKHASHMSMWVFCNERAAAAVCMALFPINLLGSRSNAGAMDGNMLYLHTTHRQEFSLSRLLPLRSAKQQTNLPQENLLGTYIGRNHSCRARSPG